MCVPHWRLGPMLYGVYELYGVCCRQYGGVKRCGPPGSAKDLDFLGAVWRLPSGPQSTGAFRQCISSHPYIPMSMH